MVKKIALLVLIVIFLILRFRGLETMPPHLRNDEAALGYNAYSILETGRDEHNHFLPILFQSFGDWKPGLYIYLSIPIISILGLNELAVRLPSAISGIGSLIFVYLITYKLFLNQRIAFISVLITAFSPWHIVFSRGAWEANVSLMLSLGGIYFFLKSPQKPFFLILSTVFFALTFLTYHGAKASTPLILIVLTITFWRKVGKINKTIIIICFIMAALISYPVISSFFTGQSARINSLSLSNLSPQTYINAVISQSGEKQSDLTAMLYHNQFFVYFRSIFWRWSEHFTLSTLFLKGDLNPQHTPPNTGPFILLNILFLMVGLIKQVKSKWTKEIKFLWLWLIVSPIPSSLTVESVNFVRTLFMFIPLIIIMSVGVYYLLRHVKNNLHNPIYFYTLIIFATFYLLNYLYFIDQYFIHASKKSGAWQYGYKQLISKIMQVKSSYQKIYILDSADQPYIFFLFFNRYPSYKIERNNQGLVSNIDNIEFTKIDWTSYKPHIDSLYVLPINDTPKVPSLDYQVIDEITDLNKHALFKIIKFK